ncbi:MAG: glycosyltransferase [Steroidobacterales bacterium]|jgi:glycosyltransferase involved in cell wall biosynthesis
MAVNNPPIWIAVLAHNEEDIVAATLQSLARQKLSDGKTIKLLVVANGCTDGTADRVRALQATLPNLELLSLLEKGKVNAIRAALDHFASERAKGACGELVGLADADIQIPDDSILERMHAHLAKHPDLYLVSASPCARVSQRAASWAARGIIETRTFVNRIMGANLIRGQLCLARLSRLQQADIPATVVSDDMYWTHMLNGHFLMDHTCVVYTEGKTRLRAEIKRTTFLVAARHQLYAPGGCIRRRSLEPQTARPEWRGYRPRPRQIFSFLIHKRLWKSMVFLALWMPCNTYCELAGWLSHRRTRGRASDLHDMWNTSR